MGELREARWAVISERGCEATGLEHAAAAALVRKLVGEKLSGLCIITNDAARRYSAHAGTKIETSNPSTSSGSNNNHGAGSQARVSATRRRRTTKSTS